MQSCEASQFAFVFAVFWAKNVGCTFSTFKFFTAVFHPIKRLFRMCIRIPSDVFRYFVNAGCINVGILVQFPRVEIFGMEPFVSESLTFHLNGEQ